MLLPSAPAFPASSACGAPPPCRRYASAACPARFELLNVYIPGSRWLGAFDRVHVGASVPPDRLAPLVALLKPEVGGPRRRRRHLNLRLTPCWRPARCPARAADTTRQGNLRRFLPRRRPQLRAGRTDRGACRTQRPACHHQAPKRRGVAAGKCRWMPPGADVRGSGCLRASAEPARALQVAKPAFGCERASPPGVPSARDQRPVSRRLPRPASPCPHPPTLLDPPTPLRAGHLPGPLLRPGGAVRRAGAAGHAARRAPRAHRAQPPPLHLRPGRAGHPVQGQPGRQHARRLVQRRLRRLCALLLAHRGWVGGSSAGECGLLARRGRLQLL